MDKEHRKLLATIRQTQSVTDGEGDGEFGEGQRTVGKLVLRAQCPKHLEEEDVRCCVLP